MPEQNEIKIKNKKSVEKLNAALGITDPSKGIADVLDEIIVPSSKMFNEQAGSSCTFSNNTNQALSSVNGKIDDIFNEEICELDADLNSIAAITNTTNLPGTNGDSSCSSPSSSSSSSYSAQLVSPDNECSSLANQLSDINIQAHFKNIEELIEVSKEIITHVYNSITTSDLIDSELVTACATFIETCHNNIKEYLNIYQDRIKFAERIKIESIQQQHRKELLQFKHNLDMERLAAKTVDLTENTQDINGQPLVQYSQEQIVKLLQNI